MTLRLKIDLCGFKKGDIIEAVDYNYIPDYYVLADGMKISGGSVEEGNMIEGRFVPCTFENTADWNKL